MFVACTLPVFFWVTLSFLDGLPAMLLRHSLWDIAGVASYVFAFALLESLVFMLPFLLMAFVLPVKFSRAHFVALGSLIALITGIWGMYVNKRGFYYGAVTGDMFLTGLVLYLISIVIPSLLVLRYPRFEQGVKSFVERFSVLAYIYLPLACIGVVIVLIRNF